MKKSLAHLAAFLLVFVSINNIHAGTLALDKEVKKSILGYCLAFDDVADDIKLEVARTNNNGESTKSTSSCSAYLKMQPTQTKDELKQEINLADMRAAYCHLYNALSGLGADNGFYSTLSSHETEDGSATKITFRFDKNPC
ncbi:hypothetical protein [uncultured Pseudoteredinibacter sp.]|uniref:hypothetical protein n=1 Tax=uncultured Pseudoteredinibacter sp. TaxID=1641701 RepID=UPI002632AFCD|nr:hypothetical protein [uncultured Pseudoteredinibacter sp.]